MKKVLSCQVETYFIILLFVFSLMACLREVTKRHFSPNVSDPESQADGDSQEVLSLAKEILLQGLIDENAELQWVNSVVMTEVISP